MSSVQAELEAQLAAMGYDRYDDGFWRAYVGGEQAQAVGVNQLFDVARIVNGQILIDRKIQTLGVIEFMTTNLKVDDEGEVVRK